LIDGNQVLGLQTTVADVQHYRCSIIICLYAQPDFA